MTPLMLFFIVAALFLLGLLLWALLPAKRALPSADQILAALSKPRQLRHFPQIQRIVDREDIAFLRKRGLTEQARRVASERRWIALGFLKELQEEYELLLEGSKLLSVMSPELEPMPEWRRAVLGIRFSLYCRLFRLGLSYGFSPWPAFRHLRDMAGELSYRLDAAMAKMGEAASVAADPLASLGDRGRNSR